MRAPRAVLKNAMPLDWSLTSDSHEVRKAVATTYDLLLTAPIYQRRPKDPDAARKAVEVVLLNLFIAYFHQPERYVFYPRSKGIIDDETPLTASSLLKVIDALEQLALIENVIGEPGSGLYDIETRRQLRSRMRATPKLLALLQEHGVRMRAIRSGRDFPLIRLKNQNKMLIPLPTDGASRTRIEQMESNLQHINTLIERTFIGLHVTDSRLKQINRRLSNDQDRFALNFARKKLYRVFNNGSLERGGRFTGGWWQDVPSDDRPHIYVGGPQSHYAKFSAEVDYSSMFPSIAYALLGKELDDSAYRLGGNELPKPIRKVVKQTLLTMLMEESPEKTRKAVHKALSDDEIKRDPDKHRQILEWKKRNAGKTYMLPFEDCAPEGCPPLVEIIKAMEKQHEPLAQDFFYDPDMGLYLMYRESQIAERVMLDMAEQGAPVLPIHDSFIAMTSWVGYAHEHDQKTGQGGWLDTAMRRAFRDELGVEARVTFDYREPETEADQGPQWKDAESIEELLEKTFPSSGETREDYDTYNRHHDDWYKGRHEDEEERSTTQTSDEDLDELDT
jgi:hypothetical protein